MPPPCLPLDVFADLAAADAITPLIFSLCLRFAADAYAMRH